MEDNSARDMILWFFLALFLVSIFLLGWLLWPFMPIIILAMVVSGIFSPIFLFFKKKLRPALASILTCLIIFVVLFIPIVLFVGILSKEAYDLYLMGKSAVLSDELKILYEKSHILNKINSILSNFNFQLTGEELNAGISEVGKVVGLFLYKQASAIASNVFKFVVNFFFMLLVIYFLLIDGKKIVSFIVDLSPLPKDQDQKLIKKFRDMAGAILIGNGLGGLFQGILGGGVFALFGLKSPFLWGVIMALLAFLPIVGVGIVFIPASIYLILSGRIGAGIFFMVFYVLLSGIIEYIFKPKLVGNRVNMPTLLVFLSIIGGLKLFGILGIIYGPLVVTAFLSLTEIYRASYQNLVAPDRRTD